MHARSFVGMTMGARKRAARREVADRAILIDPFTFYLYKEHRKAYRIGERLRPCPGCPDCVGRSRPSAHAIHGRLCGAQGILPARRST